VAQVAIQPGEAVKVASVSLNVIGAFNDGSAANLDRLSAIRQDWSLREGGIFRHRGWEDAKRRALLGLVAEGYPAARIGASRATVDPETGEARLEVEIDSGPAFTFGEVQVGGLSRYPTGIIERLNPIHPGEPYSQAKLFEFQTRLRDSPYFLSATVSADIDPDHPRNIPVSVKVEERPSRSLGFGVGASTDTGPRLRLDYGDLNIRGLGWRFSASALADLKQQWLSAGLALPLDQRGFQHSINAKLERTDIEDQTTHALTVGARRSRLRGKIETAVGIDYTGERREVPESGADTNTALTASYTWTRRDVDDLLYPTRGTLLSLGVGGGLDALLSSQDFLRVHGRGMYFHPLGRRGNFMLRSELGAVLADSRDGIPDSFLFRTGGDQSVRGYDYQSLGVEEAGAVVGGRYLVVASAEYVHWLLPKWGGAVFYDVGDAADASDAISLRQGYGLGVRWKSPVGPLNLDVAYGEESEQVRLHFSASFAF
jgi:translocation and assembly module TamA